MYEHVIFETLSGTFNAILGGNVYNVMLHVNAATLRGLTPLFCVLYNVVLENHSVQNSPWGGRGSIASSRPITHVIFIFVLLFTIFKQA